MTSADADTIINALGLKPHPEGGWYAETFRDEVTIEGRAASTAIYYLLKEGESSWWHRVDAAETWHYYAGAPLLLSLAEKGGARTIRLGLNIAAGERPQAVVPHHCWQSAKSSGAWTLVGCIVAPGFQFNGFELAPKGFNPGIR
ncbi:MAG: cupin domain-containing protein [Parvularculaceae bacterium]